MKFFTFTILVLVALARCEGVQDKRGVVGDQQAYSVQAPASLAYTKVQQPLQKTVVAAAPQPQYYAQAAPAPAPAPAAYAFPAQQQYQYQPQAQAVAYAQPTFAKYAPAPAAKVATPVYRPQFSLANDVSSFTYSSPVVQYNNLGLLSQVVGKLANPSLQVQGKVAAAPAPAAYQAQLQQSAPVSYAPAPVAQTKYALPAAQPAQRFVAAAPQQYLAQVPQQAYLGAPQGQAQAYQTAQTAQATQAYSAQNIPQSIYSQVPQLYNGGQQLKQANPGVAYAQ